MSKITQQTIIKRKKCFTAIIQCFLFSNKENSKHSISIKEIIHFVLLLYLKIFQNPGQSKLITKKTTTTKKNPNIFLPMDLNPKSTESKWK